MTFAAMLAADRKNIVYNPDEAGTAGIWIPQATGAVWSDGLAWESDAAADWEETSADGLTKQVRGRFFRTREAVTGEGMVVSVMEPTFEVLSADVPGLLDGDGWLINGNAYTVKGSFLNRDGLFTTLLLREA